MRISTAIILAGGLGTRLRSAVPDLPKCMAPVNNKPFLAYVIEYLKKEGITHFIFSLGYKSEVVISYLNKKHLSLNKTYTIESEPLGTGGGIQLACNKALEENVVIVNGDTLFNVNISEIISEHFRLKADCTIALKHLIDFSRYGSVELNTDLSIKSFHEKKYCNEGFINGGLYVLNVKKFLAQKLQPPFSFEKEFLEKNIKTLKFYGIEINSFFIDIGIPEDYKLFQDYNNLILSKGKYKETNEYTISHPTDYGDFIDFIESIFQIFDD